MTGTAVRTEATPLGGVAWLEVKADRVEEAVARIWTGPLGLQIVPLSPRTTPYYFNGGRLRATRSIWAASTVGGAELNRPARTPSATSEPTVHLLARIEAAGSVLEPGGSAGRGVLRIIDPWAEVCERFVGNAHVFTLNVPIAAVGIEPAAVTAMFGWSYELTPLQAQLLRAAVALLVPGQDELITPTHLDAVDRYLGALAGLLLRTVGDHPADVEPERSLRARVDAIISTQAADPLLTPAVIAGQLNTSLRQLYRAFNGTESPAARIRRHRLERAADLLTSRPGRPPVDEVAQECGFASAEYFSRAFRREFGVSPRAYRSAHREPSAIS